MRSTHLREFIIDILATYFSFKSHCRASYVYVYISCKSWSGGLEYNSLFVGLGSWGVRGKKRKICQEDGG